MFNGWFCYLQYKNLLKKIDLIDFFFFSKYLKLIYFDILEYFHIARTYFATLQDFYFLFFIL